MGLDMKVLCKLVQLDIFEIVFKSWVAKKVRCIRQIFDLLFNWYFFRFMTPKTPGIWFKWRPSTTLCFAIISIACIALLAFVIIFVSASHDTSVTIPKMAVKKVQETSCLSNRHKFQKIVNFCESQFEANLDKE